MRLWPSILLLQFPTTLGIGQGSHPGKASGLPNRPVALVRSLYQQVVVRHPSGIPQGKDMKIFAPYMSKRLLHRIDLFLACAADWNRQYENPDEPLKAPFGVPESGLFSGEDERTEPLYFHIEREESEKDGSVRVYVKLTWNDLPRFPDWEVWDVAAVVIHEDGHSVVDDVIYLKDKDRPDETDWRLSQSLSQGCDGPRWVGEGRQEPPARREPLRTRAMWVH